MTACGSAQFSCSQLLLQLVIFGLANGAIIALNAISVTLVYSVVRMLNFAHGDLFSLLYGFGSRINHDFGLASLALHGSRLD